LSRCLPRGWHLSRFRWAPLPLPLRVLRLPVALRLESLPALGLPVAQPFTPVLLTLIQPLALALLPATEVVCLLGRSFTVAPVVAVVVSTVVLVAIVGLRVAVVGLRVAAIVVGPARIGDARKPRTTRVAVVAAREATVQENADRERRFTCIPHDLSSSRRLRTRRCPFFERRELDGLRIELVRAGGRAGRVRSRPSRRGPSCARGRSSTSRPRAGSTRWRGTRDRSARRRSSSRSCDGARARRRCRHRRRSPDRGPRRRWARSRCRTTA